MTTKQTPHGKKSPSVERVLRKIAPQPAPPALKSHLVHTGGIKSVARTVARTHRIRGG
jgi:hypothetical protein